MEPRLGETKQVVAKLRYILGTFATLLGLVAITIVGGYLQLNGNWDTFDGRPICLRGRPDVSLGSAIAISFGIYPKCSR